MLALKMIRERRNLTQTAVAREIGVSRQTYNNWELGKRQADYESLLKLAELFETTVENILTGCLETSVLTDQQEHLAKLVEDTHPEGLPAALSLTMGIGAKNSAPAVVPTRSAALDKYSTLTEDDYKMLDVFAEFLISRHGKSDDSDDTEQT